MRKVKMFFAFILILILATGTGVAQAKTWKIKLGHPGSTDPTNTWMVGSNFLKNYLESKSQGRLQLEIYPSGQLGDMRAMLEQVQMGNLELTHLTLNGFAWFFPQIVVLGAPYIFPNDEVVEHVTKNWFIDEIRQGLLKKTKTIRLIGAGNLGRWRSFFTTKKQIKTASDLKGVKIRTIPDPMQIEMVKSLGGNPTPMPWPEVYTSLASGVLEGIKFEVYLLGLYKLDEFCKFGVMDEHSYMWSMIAANDTWLKSLPKDLQNIVVDGVSMTINVVQEYAKALEIGARESFEKKGGTIYVPTAEEMATFRAAKAPMMDWFKKNVEQGDVWLEKLTKAIKEAEEAINNKRTIILE